MDPDLTVTIDLLRAAQGGDAEACNRLFERYYPRVRRIVGVRLGEPLRRRVDVSDILQETFAAAVDAFDRFEVRDEGSFINWLARIAEHQVLAAADHHGAQKRNPAREVPLAHADASGPIGIDPVATGLLPPDQVVRAEEILLVETCVAALPEAYRELIILRNYAGASWDTVAAETGRPSAAAARMMHAKAVIELGKEFRRRRNG